MLSNVPTLHAANDIHAWSHVERPTPAEGLGTVGSRSDGQTTAPQGKRAQKANACSQGSRDR